MTDQITDAQIRELAARIAADANAIATPARHGPPDPSWLRDQAALLATHVSTLSQWVQSVPDTGSIVLSPAAQRLLVEYAEVDSGQRLVAGVDMPMRTRGHARAALIRQDLLQEVRGKGDPWLTDLGRMFAAGLREAGLVP